MPPPTHDAEDDADEEEDDADDKQEEEELEEVNHDEMPTKKMVKCMTMIPCSSS